MKKIMVSLAMAAFALVILASVFAFSMSLYDLHINATTFQSVGTPTRYERMSPADEGAISAPMSMETVDSPQPNSRCQKSSAQHDRNVGF